MYDCFYKSGGSFEKGFGLLSRAVRVELGQV